MLRNLLSVAFLSVFFAACVTTDEATSAPAGGPSGAGAFTRQVEQGQVRVLEAGETVSVLKTASPNIEVARFTGPGQEEMVVKSRGNHGPATVELFDTRTGQLKDKVLAFAIQNGQPSWAAGMED